MVKPNSTEMFFYGGITLFNFLQNIWTIFTLIIITLLIIDNSLAGTINDSANFFELMKESSKLNVSVALGLGALVIACLIFQNKSDLKSNRSKYSDYIGIMFTFILLNLGVFYLSYFPKLAVYKGVLIIYFVLTMAGFTSLLFSTSRILCTIFNKHS
ncbi:hypothetical protein MLOOGBEN_06530 [Bacillus sp. EB106-08-02-XG196]|uniref:hypothetical protein n=1 Tax=Bacillus sp. EB106-08-02-XG196 TaxID=2737049 RepID=UPI0017BE63FF|nr:hypothetical protein [Bacillus sp. EB106-08-02-XG196]NWQ40355.1 hypothetical protein [Bacillus sp. EB106-08-02-XG196]